MGFLSFRDQYFCYLYPNLQDVFSTGCYIIQNLDFLSLDMRITDHERDDLSHSLVRDHHTSNFVTRYDR